MKYRDKETIEAVRWDGLYFSEQPEWLRRGIAAGSIEIVKDKVAIIDTAGGSIAFPGDYIIFGYILGIQRYSRNILKKQNNMKYKKKLANIKAAQAWWDKQDQKYKDATTRPGSIKQRVITGA